MNKCPKCGYDLKKQYCQCKDLTIFDLMINIMDNKDYCRKCDKEVTKIKADIILSKGV